MNEDVKKLWVDALRSGEYTQVQQGLYNGVGYCCLGVLCELHRRLHKREWVIEAGSSYRYYYGRAGVLPTVVIEWAGLDNISPVINFKSLTTYNDVDCMSFSQIADLIEEHL